MINKILALLICTLLVVEILSGCGETNENISTETTLNTKNIEIPDLSGLDESSAKSLLVNKGLIPAIEHQYDDTVEQGLVIKTYPSEGSFASEDDKITIYISDGPSYISSDNSTIRWYNNDDEWHFSNPYIDNGNMYIDCETIFADSFEWDDGFDSDGEGFGEASINDTFDKTVPLKIIYDDEKVKAGEEEYFTIVVPVTDLDVDLPTTICLALTGKKGDEQLHIRVDFNITW